MRYDVVIIGAGFAGLTVANHVALAGLRPLVLETGTGEFYPCNSRVSTGAIHLAFRSPDEPASELFESILSGTDGSAREDIAWALAANAKSTIDWMRQEGCEFMQHPRRSWGMPMMMPGREMRAGLDWENSGPNLFLGTLTEKLRQRGGELRLGTRVIELQMEHGSVSGVITEDGQELQTTAVVIADGGFQADRDLIGQYITRAPNKLRQRNTETGRGDGLRMAIRVGADTVSLDKFYGHVLSREAMTEENLWPYPQLDIVCAKGIVVTPDGCRFANEGFGGIYLTNEIAALADPLSATAVFDRTVWEDARETDIVPPNPSLTENGGTLLEAASLNELAQISGIDPDGLAATVSGYNDLVRSGNSSALLPARTTQMYPAYPIEHSPFFAIPLCAGITVTSGGLAVDKNAQVLDKNGVPIAGLYAAGSAVGGLEGGPRAGYVGGLMKAFGIGRIAGRAIAESLA